MRFVDWLLALEDRDFERKFGVGGSKRATWKGMSLPPTKWRVHVARCQALAERVRLGYLRWQPLASEDGRSHRHWAEKR